jgi:uncharacterized membrane protein YsdA (DUF1294 family)
MTKTNDNERQYRDSLQFPASEAENLCSFNTRLAEVTYYLIIINIAIFLVYGIDKWKAKKSLWRIREASLLVLAVLGGSIGAWLGMKVWHHKTQHKKFRYGIPVIIIIQLVIIGYFLYIQYKHKI